MERNIVGVEDFQPLRIQIIKFSTIMSPLRGLWRNIVRADIRHGVRHGEAPTNTINFLP